MKFGGGFGVEFGVKFGVIVSWQLARRSQSKTLEINS